MKKFFNALRGRKFAPTAISIVLVGILVGLTALYAYRAHIAQTELFGKKILYSTRFHYMRDISVYGQERVLLGECMKSESTIQISSDTLILTTPNGKLGFKPLGVNRDQSNQLFCIRADGVRVIFAKLRLTGADTVEESVIFVQPEGDILLTQKNGCVKE